MTVTVLALTTLRPGGEVALQACIAAVGPLMQAAGARLVSRHSVSRVLAGEGTIRHVSPVSYPSEQAVRLVFDSPAYRALDQIREAAFSCYEVCTIDPAI